MITGIIVALPEELGTLTTKKIVKGQCDFIAENILVACSGAGRDNATKAAKLLVSKGATKLISWGCAGALSPDLNAGDLVLPEKLLSATQEEFKIDKNWLEFFKKNIAVEHHSESLIESLEIIAQSEDKKNLYQQTQAIAVDMESAAVVKIAQKYNIPSLVIRAIADPVSMNLPQAVTHAMNAEGEVVLSKLLVCLLSHPQQIPALIKLGLHFSAAKNKLKVVAKHLDIISGFELNTSA